MSLPTKDELQSLDFARLGLPFAHVEAKELSSGGLDFARLGLPFVGAASSAGEEPPPHFNGKFYLVM